MQFSQFLDGCKQALRFDCAWLTWYLIPNFWRHSILLKVVVQEIQTKNWKNSIALTIKYLLTYMGVFVVCGCPKVTS